MGRWLKDGERCRGKDRSPCRRASVGRSKAARQCQGPGEFSNLGYCLVPRNPRMKQKRN